MSPRAKRIISEGKGVCATPILQPTTPVARLYRPRHIRLPAHEPMQPPTAITDGPSLLHRRLR